MPINNNLKELRLQRKLTQGELAEKANIELTQVSRIERGASEPKLETIKKLALALQCTTDELIMDKDEKVLEPKYLKILLQRINQLSPLKRYVILDMLQSYLAINEIKQPSIIEQFGNSMHEGDYQDLILRDEVERLSEEHQIIDEIDEEIKNKIIPLEMELHDKGII